MPGHPKEGVDISIFLCYNPSMKRKFFQWRIADWFRLVTAYSILLNCLGTHMLQSVVAAAEVAEMWSK